MGALAARWEWLAFAAVLVLAAALRFVDLPTRGTWDRDQGHDMLVLRAFVRDGVFPFLGPPTSIGTFHHGALYYLILAPTAALTGASQLAVVGTIAAFGTAAVAVTWWLARSIAGPVAGLVTGLLMATSATAIEESTFIWNPNLIPLFSAVAVAAAFRAWRTGRARWWVVAAAAQAATMQLHVLGVVMLPPLGALFLADVVRRPRYERPRVLRLGAVSVLVIVVSYLPLFAYELSHDFAESRAIADYLFEGGQATALGPLARLAFVNLRILAWPVAGLITNAPVAGVLSAVVVLVVLGWRLRVARGFERLSVRWLAGCLAFSGLVLGLGVSGLTTVTPLPVDHYHAFLDPLVFMALGLGTAGLWQLGGFGRVLGASAVAAALAWSVTIWPPATHPDGGYPAAEIAAARIRMQSNGGSLALLSLPSIKSAEAYEFPIVSSGGTVGPVEGADTLAVICDDLFVPDCGGPAEDAAVTGLELRLIERFVPATGRTISIYRR
jgi:4-amino-4-deoxy-L-arabinose transferase-like glycosyltransferase